MRFELKLISGNANPQLAEQISEALGVPLCEAEVSRFPDGEINIHIKETVRGADVFVIQPTSPPVNEHLMELLLLIDALKRASAGRVTAVIPYYGYARQDRKHVGRVPISARLVANLIEAAGADRMLTLDLHAGQIQGFFNIPVDNLKADPIFARYFQERGLADEEAVIVSPDLGAVKRARAVAERLGVPLAIVEKRRMSSGQVVSLNLIGEVEGRRAILIDDIISTGGTLIETLGLLERKRAREIYAAFTHGVFAEGALERIREVIRSSLEGSPLRRLVVTNTIPLPPGGDDIIDCVAVGELFAEVIRRIHEHRSVSEIFPHY